MVITATDGRAGIDAALVQRLIAAQFPQWSDLPVTPVEVDGWDNRTYRVGKDMTARLPTAAGYVPAVAKESCWLPRLAPSLPVAVPESWPAACRAWAIRSRDPCAPGCSHQPL